MIGSEGQLISAIHLCTRSRCSSLPKKTLPRAVPKQRLAGIARVTLRSSQGRLETNTIAVRQKLGSHSLYWQPPADAPRQSEASCRGLGSNARCLVVLVGSGAWTVRIASHREPC